MVYEQRFKPKNSIQIFLLKGRQKKKSKKYHQYQENEENPRIITSIIPSLESKYN